MDDKELFEGHCEVELFGVARLRAKTGRVSVAVHGATTLADLFARLAEQCPALVGPVLDPKGDRLARGNACNINGREFVQDPNFVIRPGDHVLFVSSDAGG